MTNASAAKSLAVLIDGDNFPADLASALFSAVSKLGTVAVRRVYGSSSGIAGWRGAAMIHGIGLHEAMPGKNATDMKLAIDAMDIHHRGKVGGFCIVSSDSDFAELARRLREDGVSVHGFGEGKAAVGFRNACDSFVALGLTKPVKEVVQPSSSKPQPAMREVRALLERAIARLGPNTTRVTLGVLGYQVKQLDGEFSAKRYGAKNLRALVIMSGLELSFVEEKWIVMVPAMLRSAA